MRAAGVVAELVLPDGLVYRLSCSDGLYRLDVADVAAFTWPADGSGTVETRLQPGVSASLADVLATGLVTAARATVEGHAVLHASAVEVDGQAVAVLGPVGTGKSTVAAMLCAAGARLLTDDVLVLDDADGVVTCRRASPQIRLRPAAAGLTELFDIPPASTNTPDGRVGITPPPSAHQRCPLRAVILPRPSRQAAQVDLTPVSSASAVFSLLAEPRVHGLSRSHQQRLFEMVTALASQAVVHEAVIPWGPPWSKQVAADLLEAAR